MAGGQGLPPRLAEAGKCLTEQCRPLPWTACAQADPAAPSVKAHVQQGSRPLSRRLAPGWRRP